MGLWKGILLRQREETAQFEFFKFIREGICDLFLFFGAHIEAKIKKGPHSVNLSYFVEINVEFYRTTRKPITIH